LDILVLGGTVFLGRHLVDAALARGHRVTLFHRGRSNPGLFPEAETILGDRTEDLGALSGRRWDAVVDTSGYLPRVVRASAEALADAVDHYTFVSSISVYVDPWRGSPDEDSPVATIEDETVEEVTGETYGPLKALSEQAVEAALPGRTLVVRPGLIVGPHDPSDRFTYWPRRVAKGGEVLSPGRPERLIQVIDARDLAGWMLDLVERSATGTFNATGPEEPVPMQRLLETCRSVAGSDARFTWVAEDFLLEQGVAPWSELPLWIPDADDITPIGRALAAGLRFRPLADTVRDTLAWDATRPADTTYRSGLGPAREAELLRAWHEARPDEETTP
jgi:2'-hydroxyisoflavone reductase